MEAAGLDGKSTEEQSLDTNWLVSQPLPLLGEHGRHLVASTEEVPVHWLTRMWEGLHARGDVMLQALHLVTSEVEFPRQNSVCICPGKHLAHGRHFRESNVVVPSQRPKM